MINSSISDDDDDEDEDGNVIQLYTKESHLSSSGIPEARINQPCTPASQILIPNIFVIKIKS